MGIYSWDLDGGFSTAPLVRTPRLTIRCEYPDTDLPPTEVTFRLSPSYGLLTAREAHEWFLLMMRSHDEFEVETDGAVTGGGRQIRSSSTSYPTRSTPDLVLPWKPE